MKENIINEIKKQISHYKGRLSKFNFSQTREEHKQRGFEEGTIHGLEQALISAQRG